MRKTDKSYTIADIADKAGVSKTTVSRFLNGRYQYMSENTRVRIAQIIGEANYHPNNIARGLKLQRSMLVGLAISDIGSPFSAAVIKGAGNRLRGTGYNLVTANCDNSYEIEREVINSLIYQRIDGLIVNTTSEENPLLAELAGSGLPIVLADRKVSGKQFDFVGIENKNAIETAVSHLLENGYGSMAYITQSYKNISVRSLRRSAFIEALERRGIANAAECVHVIDVDRPSSVAGVVDRVAAKAYGEKPPAIIAATSIVLFNVVSAVKSLGLKMPCEIGVCGYDDWNWGPEMSWVSLVSPGITTMTVPSRLIGENCADLLLARMNDKSLPPRAIEVSTTLVKRGSTALGG